MKNFKLDNDIDYHKIFLIKSSELEGRFDPYYYSDKFHELKEKINNCSYPVKHLKSISKTLTNGFDFRDFKNFGIPYLKVSNIKPGYIDLTETFYVDFDSQQTGKNIILQKGDIILTRKGTFGVSVSIKENLNYVICSEIFKLQLTNEILSDYLEIILNSNIGQLQFDQKKIGAIMGSLSQEAVKSVLIPVPDLDFQKKVIDIYNIAIKSKDQKESQANELLKSIDEYLLSELGIILPTKDNSIQNRIFTTTYRQVSGNRFDPKQYETFAQNLFAAIENSKYDKIRLKKLITQSVAGDWGLDETAPIDENEYTKCLVIRATEFDNDFNLNISNSRAKFRLIKNDKLQKLDIKCNDLLIEKSGGSPDQPVGRISIFTKELVNDNTLCYSNFIHKIRVDTTEILPEYLFCFLKTIHNIKVTEIMQSQTNGIRNLIMREYLNQKIVIPDKPKQKEISDKANKMRDKAKQLREEAINELNKARETIEKMILE